MRLFEVWVRNCNQRCWSCWGKPLIYDPIWSPLCQRAFCVPLSRLQGQNTTPSLQPSLLARHPSFNDRTQWSVQCQRSSLNNIITLSQRGDESRYQLQLGYRINFKYQGWVIFTVSLYISSQKETFTCFIFGNTTALATVEGKKWKENGIKE